MDRSATRLYGGSIGVVSGGYSLWRGLDGMAGADWVMALVGLVAFVHGVVLFTSAADRLGDASGPLMLAYALVMLALQAWAATAPAMGMGDGMGGMGGGMDTAARAMGADAGMVALALLMLVSGAIMTARDGGEM